MQGGEPAVLIRRWLPRYLYILVIRQATNGGIAPRSWFVLEQTGIGHNILGNLWEITSVTCGVCMTSATFGFIEYCIKMKVESPLHTNT
jgi:hypothetical protein